MSGVNKVILIGRLGRDPEVRTANSGSRIVSFSLATSDTWRDKATGERKERTEWHNVVVFNEGLGKIAEQYCRKGQQLYVEGKLRMRTYTDRDGNERKATEVVLEQYNGELALLERSDRPAPDQNSYGTTKTRPTQDQRDDPRQTMGTQSASEFINDDIPF